VVRRDEALAVEAARTSRGTEFHLHRLGCAGAQLEALRSGRAADPRAADVHARRCRELGTGNG
jgi:hypothetical protein